jgi:uncharacterized delta-60 repeat protein
MARLDSSFDGDGVVTSNTGAGGYDVPGGTALQADGRIVVAGSNDRDVTLARYNSDGSLDPTFGIGGKVVTDFSGRQEGGYAMCLQPDGRILVAGRSIRPTTSRPISRRAIPCRRVDRHHLRQRWVGYDSFREWLGRSSGSRGARRR